jgi:hypothetical protein
MLQSCANTHQERTLGTLVSFFNDFGFAKHNCFGFKSVIFFHLWKLWLKHGDNAMSGNPENVNDVDSCVSQQCFWIFKSLVILLFC